MKNLAYLGILVQLCVLIISVGYSASRRTSADDIQNKITLMNKLVVLRMDELDDVSSAAAIMSQNYCGPNSKKVSDLLHSAQMRDDKVKELLKEANSGR